MILPLNRAVLLSAGVSGLSNIFRRRDGGEDASGLTVRPAKTSEINDATAILLGQHGKRADANHVNEFLHYAHQRLIDLSQLWVAVLADKIVASALPVYAPGRTALLLVSTQPAGKRLDFALSECIKSACEAIDPKQAGIIQILLDTDDQRTSSLIRNNGFEDLADLIYLQRTFSKPVTAPELPLHLCLLTYSPETHSQFAQAILSSYEDSLDCPLLHGQREINDVIAGHQSAGEHDPNLWFCLVEHNIPCGVLLLSPLPGHGTMELVYIGLAPHARGRNLGEYLIKLAMHHTTARKLRAITLAVDAINPPALHLYHRHGFAEIHRRHAMIRIL